MTSSKDVEELRRLLKTKDDLLLMKEEVIRSKDELLKSKDDLLRSKEDIISIQTRKLASKDREIKTLREQLQESQATTGAPRVVRSQGVSAEPRKDTAISLQHLPKTLFTKHDKLPATTELINRAIQDNDFMKKLDAAQIREIVDCMHRVEFAKGDVIIREGDVGSLVYAIEEGKVEISKEKEKLCTLGPGKVFGELAILYNCTRTATVKAVAPCKLWAIERNVFKNIMVRTGLEIQKQHVDFLKSAKRFKDMEEEKLNQIADALEEVQFRNGDYIIRQGTRGDTFYILSKGKVLVTKNDEGTGEEKFIKELNVGEYFGELALETDEDRAANIIASDPSGVTCLVLEREPYKQLLSKVNIRRESPPENNIKSTDEFSGLKPKDFTVIQTLGIGGFGRVELVTIGGDPKRVYALKKLTKQHIVETRQQEHLANERNIMKASQSDFICRLYGTMRDTRYIYMILEPCLGGELWTLLRNKNAFDDTATKFYAGCVVEALSYLHARGIVYRDLKPENLLLDRAGYIKLVDFGFSKKIPRGQKTWTFCGTPEYVAPEIILNKGHDLAVDLWSLGILIYELHTGSPPFAGSDHMKTYNSILRGIDVISFPKKFKKSAERIIKHLCRDNPTERLGFGASGLKDVQKHKWFVGLNWDALRTHTLKAPIVPLIKHSTDGSNFDHFPPDESVAPECTDNTGWDKDF